MTQETVEKLWDHRHVCDSHEFTKTTVQRDEATGDRFYLYRCLKCQWLYREPLVYAEQEAKPAAQKAA